MENIPEYTEQKYAEGISSRIIDSQKFFFMRALGDFAKKDYSQCIENLKLCGTNSKVEHNIAVTNFSESELVDHESFFNAMDKISENTVKKLPAIIEENLTDNEAYSYFTSTFNKAIVLFHLRHELDALDLLLGLLKYKHLMDRELLKRFTILILHLLLATNQCKQAQQCLNELADSLKINLNLLFIRDDSEESDSNIINTEFNLQISKNKFLRILRIVAIRLNVLCGLDQMKYFNFYTDEPELIMLHARQCYERREYQQAGDILSQILKYKDIINLTGDNCEAYVANNSALIHWSVKNLAISQRFLQAALNFDDLSSEKNLTAPIYLRCGLRKPEILYNLGILLLHNHHPKAAFECLLVSVNYYARNPRIWLRLGETCIMMEEKKKNKLWTKNGAFTVIGSGIHRTFILNNTTNRISWNSGDSYAIPSPTIEFGILCLKNALLLIERNLIACEATDSEEQTYFITTKSLTVQVLNHLRMKVLTTLAYCCLCMDDYVMCYEHCRLLLELADVPSAYKILCIFYITESLIMLNRINEVDNYLNDTILEKLNDEQFSFPYTKEWKLPTADIACEIYKYQVAVKLAFQRNYKASMEYLNQIRHPQLFNIMKLLRIYLDLKTGNFQFLQKYLQNSIPAIM